MLVSYEQNVGFRCISLTGEIFCFDQIDDGKFSCDFNHLKEDQAIHQTVLLNLVSENELLFTKREVMQSRMARQLQKRLGYPTSESLIQMIRTGSIKNIPRITKQDVIRADRIYGKDISAFKGRTTKTNAYNCYGEL